MPILRRSSMALACLAMVVAASGAAEDEPAPRRYALSIDSELEMRVEGETKPKPLLALSRLRFEWDAAGESRRLTIRELDVLVTSDGRTLSASRIGPDGAMFREGDQPVVEYDRGSSPPLLRSRLDDFATPAARYVLDASGAEIGRELLISEESPLVQQRILENARFPLAPFSAREEVWTAPASLSISGGQLARGALRYEKIGTTAEGLTRVAVSGELKAEGPVFGGELRKGVFRVGGEQFYDPEADAWASAELNLEGSFEVLEGGELQAFVVGTIRVTLTPDRGERADLSSAGRASE